MSGCLSFAGARTLRCGSFYDSVHARRSDLPRRTRRWYGNLHARQRRTSHHTKRCTEIGSMPRGLTCCCAAFASSTMQAAQIGLYGDTKPRTKQAFDAFVSDHLAKGDPLKGGRLTVPYLRSEQRPMKSHAHVVDLVGNTYDSCESYFLVTYSMFPVVVLTSAAVSNS